MFNLKKHLLYLFSFFWKEKIFRKILACGFSKSATLTVYGGFLKKQKSELCSSTLISKDTGNLNSHCVIENLPPALMTEMELRYIEGELDTVHLCMEFPNTEKCLSFFSTNFP